MIWEHHKYVFAWDLWNCRALPLLKSVAQIIVPKILLHLAGFCSIYWSPGGLGLKLTATVANWCCYPALFTSNSWSEQCCHVFSNRCHAFTNICLEFGCFSNICYTRNILIQKPFVWQSFEKLFSSLHLWQTTISPSPLASSDFFLPLSLLGSWLLFSSSLAAASCLFIL